MERTRHDYDRTDYELLSAIYTAAQRLIQRVDRALVQVTDPDIRTTLDKARDILGDARTELSPETLP